MQNRQKTVLCIASFFKGAEFIRECKRQGSKVLLLTQENLLNEAWPRESIDEVHAMPDLHNQEDVLKGVSYLARTHNLDVIVALDDFDVETAARLREHLRIPGMGDTTARYFRDKLAMRVAAREAGFRVPSFIHVLNHGKLAEFMARIPPPWVLKPRSQASAIGIKKINSEQEFWQTIEQLGDRQSFYLLEAFIEGDVFHVDSIIAKKKVQFTSVSRYSIPPMNVAHNGGVFITSTVKYNSSERSALRDLNERLIKAFGLVRGVAHTEFIRDPQDGAFYFLETASRVGGAHIAEMVEAASGLNLWAEWAKLEVGSKPGYVPPKSKKRHAGLILTLARQSTPDSSGFHDPEIVWRLNKHHHVGLIVSAPDWHRIETLLSEYRRRFSEEFQASMPVPERATN